jgi:uncharacterized protein YbbC (DUF1343 family)
MCKASDADNEITVGAMQPQNYLHQLEGKKVALMVNHTSLVDTVHLVDFLLSKGIDIVKIFAVEHGFRGNVAYGEYLSDETDPRTGISVVSLYGEKKKASPADMANVDVAVFDMQDVGCRFYTYISSMHFLMEACAENNVPLLVLDRPNPNGDYVDGPVLQAEFHSFVGIHPIPVVHGCTVGELAQMINGEGWLAGGLKCELSVVPVEKYSHKTKYELPVKPSPNLPNYVSVRLYPSLCFFEACNVSIGRGTNFPFQVIGYPGCPVNEISFTPTVIEGVSSSPLFLNQLCTGADLRKLDELPTFTLNFLLNFFAQFDSPDEFWKSERWMNLLAGNDMLFKQINNGFTEQQIKDSWQADLAKYKATRKKYLLYTDFE